MKAIIISVVIAIVLVGGSLLLTRSGENGSVANADNVSIVDGKQIIEINARGGYQPRKSIAKAGMSTIIKFNTRGTFDCSSSVRIPSLDISRSLPQTGFTDIDIGEGKIGILKGTCGMGMYQFEIDFRN